jgi:DNA-binding MarR family transcriptional regulator
VTAALRQRDTVLAAVEVFRQARHDASITTLLAFLYICENEGLNVSELAQLMATTNATASRTASALEAGGDGRGESLIRSGAGARHGHSRVLSLTRQGEALRERIETFIDRALPIDPRRARHVAAV